MASPARVRSSDEEYVRKIGHSSRDYGDFCRKPEEQPHGSLASYDWHERVDL